jgi:hypothetical protein
VNYNSRHFALSVAVAFTVLGTSLAFAEEYAPDPLRPEFTSGLSVVDELETGFCNNVAACSGPFCDYSCRSEGIYFSADTVFVNVWQLESEGIAAEFLVLNTPAAPDIGEVDFGVDPAIRFELGYLTCDGLGVQVRYWEFDNAASMTVGQAAPADPNLVFHALDVSVVDVEVVKKSMMNIWDTTVSGGYRFARYEETAS